MERISLKKESKLKEILMTGLEATGFELCLQTDSTKNPLRVYYRQNSGTIAIYDCRPGDDELIFLDGSQPGKIKIIIKL